MPAPRSALALATLVLACITATTTPALAAGNDDAVVRGDQFFKRGHYLRASEEYRQAALTDSVSPWKKLAFGHALFAVGNYSYAEYALRRGVGALDEPGQFQVDVVALFPSRTAFQKAMRDLKRYVTYAPRDPSGLTVLGYMYYVSGEERESAEIFRILRRLNPDDEFADFFLTRLRAKGITGDDPPERSPGGPETPPPPDPLPETLPPPPTPATPEDGAKGVGPPIVVAPPAEKPESPAGVRAGESSVEGAAAPKRAIAR